MKKLATLLLVINAIVNIGCVPSLHAFYKPSDVMFEKCLVGKWADRDFRFSWQFERRGHIAYRLTQVDEDGIATTYEATLFRFDGRTFLDIVPIGIKERYGPNLLRAHSVMAITIENSRLRISSIEGNWLRETLTRNPSLVKHTTIDGELVITDTTEKLQLLIRHCLNSPGAFGPSEEIVKLGDNV